MSSGQRKDPEDEGGGPHRLLLSSLPAKNPTSVPGRSRRSGVAHKESLGVGWTLCSNGGMRRCQITTRSSVQSDLCS